LEALTIFPDLFSNLLEANQSPTTDK